MKLSSLSFLIPAYRDADTITQVVTEANATGREIAKTHEIVVINDASPDELSQVLTNLIKKYPAMRVINHPVNLGYGATIRDLYYAGKSEWLFTIPGDNQIPAAEVRKLVPYISKADMIIGWRVKRHDPPARLRQSHIYNDLLQQLFGIKLHDVNSVRLMRRSMMDKIKLKYTSAFVDAELTVRAARAGERVIEVPILHSARGDESTAGGGKLKTIIPTIWDMIRFKIIS